MSHFIDAIARSLLHRSPRSVTRTVERHVRATLRLDAGWEACRNFQAQAFDMASIARFDGRFHVLLRGAATLLDEADAQMLALPAGEAERHFCIAAQLHREQACLAAMVRAPAIAAQGH